MRLRLPLKGLSAAVTLLCASTGGAATLSTDGLAQLVDKLKQRVERLEMRDAELERQLRAGRAPRSNTESPTVADIEMRVQALEGEQARTMRALESDRLSENEPELTARLKAVEMEARSAQSAARKIEALQGISAGISLTTMAQKPYGSVGAYSQLNYRGDAFVTLPLSRIGDIEQRLFTQFRLGQGAGLNDLPSFSRANGAAFRVLGGLRPDDSVAVLAQAWYQASIPLPFGGHKPRSRETVEMNFGKMDPFVFFDQNTAANDETRQFSNTIFVHNPLLDAGGDIGVDANGFTPGFRLSYVNFMNTPATWRVSLGIFGAGAKGANYQRSLSAPLVLLQAETEQRLLAGSPGTYRIYVWRNAATSGLDENAAATGPHVGWGLSADQRIVDGITLFGRFGQIMRGHARFDRALTIGSEIIGSCWDRGGDSIGLAIGLLSTSRDYRDLSASSTPVNGAERVAELYYRFRVSKQFELSPSLQHIGNPAGVRRAGAIKILGLRAQINY